MSLLLARTLDLWAVTPFVVGVSDCLMSPADYWLKATGRDPAAAWRGSYSTDEQMRQILADNGGAFRLMRDGLDGVDAERVDLPEAGDVVCVDFKSDQVGGMCVGAKAALRFAERPGFALLPLSRLDVLGAWRP